MPDVHKRRALAIWCGLVVGTSVAAPSTALAQSTVVGTPVRGLDSMPSAVVQQISRDGKRLFVSGFLVFEPHSGTVVFDGRVVELGYAIFGAVMSPDGAFLVYNGPAARSLLKNRS